MLENLFHAVVGADGKISPMAILGLFILFLLFAMITKRVPALRKIAD